MRAPRNAGRRSRWATRAAALGVGAALVACGTANGMNDAFAAGQRAPGQRLQPRTVRRATQDTLDPTKVLEDASKRAEEAAKKAQETANAVVNAPGEISAKAQAAVDDTIENLTSDNGKVLDTSSAAGAVGAVTVATAVLPYIPVSLYSSFLVATTGQGIEPGPNGLFGAAEGFATLVVFGVALWSLTSLFTRARGLPEGPFKLLGVTQFFSWIAVLAFAGATALAGGSNINPFEPKKPPAIPKATLELEKQLDEVSKEPASFWSGLTKSFDDQIESAKKQASAQLDGVKSQVDKKASEVSDQASKQVSKATAGATEAAAKAAKEAQAKAEDAAKKATEKVGAVAEKATEKVGSVAEKAKSAAKKIELPDYDDLLAE